ncbi:hypothetical protein RvY_12719 [Ramazzottius varieornatus]|uniref:Elongator complex protein 2 n=1 Tax=Ramazzottius varieornatus TaxID=947166 RepID=A0A1D1VKH2_RAMVA|nr:hypothetical protein RvY_12719 [Ramazzottius varieornatus]
MVHAELSYLSAGCNTSPHCVAWGPNGILLFGSDVNIIACSTARAGNTTVIHADQSLRHHTGMVNCVRWISNLEPATEPVDEFISLSSDKLCTVWTVQRGLTASGDERGFTHLVVQQLECSAALQVGRCVYLPGGSNQAETNTRPAILAVAAIDGTLSVWKRLNKLGFELVTSVNFGRGLILDLDITNIPGSKHHLLACGADDGKVHLYSLSAETNECQKLTALEGHEDWVRSVEFSALDDSGSVHLLSASQDCTVRLWTIREEQSRALKDGDLWNKVNSKIIRMPGTTTNHVVTFDTLLLGHEGWIYGAHWAPSVLEESGRVRQPLRILTSSMDKSLVLWEPQEEFGGIWTETAQVGEVGGNTLGFYGCQFGPDGRLILAHSFSGSLHVWSMAEDASWRPCVVPSGHFAPVSDLSWDPQGRYILSTSQDQTTRLHARWIQPQNPTQTDWHEMSRPQVHGYDMQCLAPTGPFSFASGAEEKIVRLFQAPKNFLSNFTSLSGETTSAGMVAAPEGASVPALGLSNKPIFGHASGQGDTSQRHPSDRYAENTFTSLFMTQPPPEEDLIQNTLWPETDKLYGHGYEIASLACSHSSDGQTVLASASRASRPEDAEIYLWCATLRSVETSAQTWSLAGRIDCHTLTVTQMEFSHNDQYLLSVSRDRTWALHKRDSQKPVQYATCAKSDKKNGQSRIIWTCAWTPDDRYFATGSRDKTVCVLGVREEPSVTVVVDLIYRLTFDEAVTAISLTFAETQRVLMAIGEENGTIRLYTFDRAGTEEPSPVLVLPESHSSTVNRLRFRPTAGSLYSSYIQLATCGNDRALKLFQINF